MRLTLDKMVIRNFKGIRGGDTGLQIDFGNVTNVFGMNGTGKSTIADAFTWVLFNKDSKGNAPGTDAFRDKPLDENGNEIHNLDTTVELYCRLDGQPFNLRRTQRENWVKKRGQSEAQYQGNASTYWINDVETKLSDFRARIGQITSEEVFRLIASLSAFNALDWKRRREQLLALSGGDVDGELLARPEYRPLADEAAQRNIGIESLKKVLSDQRKRANDELRMIPVRIDEARKALPMLKESEIQDAEYIIKDCLADIERVDGQIAALKVQSGEGNSRMKILALEQELVSAKRRMSDEHAAGKKKLQSEADLASETFRKMSALLTEAKRKMDVDKAELEKATARRNSLREKFAAVRDAPLADVETVCPYCGRELPADSVEAAKQKAAQAKREELSDIKDEGKTLSSMVAMFDAAVKEDESEVEKYRAKADAAMAERDAAYEKVRAYASMPDFDADPRIAEISAQIEEEKAAAKTAPDTRLKEFETRRAELQAIVDRNRAVLVRRDAGIETQKRIEALEAQQREYGAKISEIEKLILLCERFIQDRCGALEASINSKFPTVRWKLFDIQINGGIVDCCMCMIPCDSGLVAYECANTAAQVNADVEIINVLSEHYDLRLPLFVDNSERVNAIAHTDSQLITLSVSTDSALRIENKEAS